MSCMRCTRALPDQFVIVGASNEQVERQRTQRDEQVRLWKKLQALINQNEQANDEQNDESDVSARPLLMARRKAAERRMMYLRSLSNRSASKDGDKLVCGDCHNMILEELNGEIQVSANPFN